MQKLPHNLPAAYLLISEIRRGYLICLPGIGLFATPQNREFLEYRDICDCDRFGWMEGMGCY